MAQCSTGSAVHYLTFRWWSVSVDRPLWPTQGCFRLHKAFVLKATSENALLQPLQLSRTAQRNAMIFRGRAWPFCDFQRIWSSYKSTPHSCAASEYCKKACPFLQGFWWRWEHILFSHSFYYGLWKLQEQHTFGSSFGMWLNIGMSAKMWHVNFSHSSFAIPKLYYFAYLVCYTWPSPNISLGQFPFWLSSYI